MNFNQAIKHILRYEGGYVNDPEDPGGETNYGISKRAYPNVDIKSLSYRDAKELYRRDYWKPCACALLPAKVRLMVLDMAVNQGVGYASRTLQKAVSVTPDGILGPITLSAVQTQCPITTVLRLAHARRGRYFSLKTFKYYGKGWLTRLIDVTVYTLEGGS